MKVCPASTEALVPGGPQTLSSSPTVAYSLAGPAESRGIGTGSHPAGSSQIAGAPVGFSSARAPSAGIASAASRPASAARLERLIGNTRKRRGGRGGRSHRLLEDGAEPIHRARPGELARARAAAL